MDLEKSMKDPSRVYESSSDLPTAYEDDGAGWLDWFSFLQSLAFIYKTAKDKPAVSTCLA